MCCTKLERMAAQLREEKQCLSANAPICDVKESFPSLIFECEEPWHQVLSGGKGF